MFLRRLFTGELRQGALAGVMADAVAKAAGVRGELARRALMLSAISPGWRRPPSPTARTGSGEVGFEILRPILPMLASTAATVAEAVASFARSSVEWKLDGIRIQIHRRADEVRIYTRNLNDITPTLPGIVEAVPGGCRSVRSCSTARRCGCADGSPAAFQDTVSLIDSDAPPRGHRDVPVRRPPRRRRGSARRAAVRARRQARGDRRRRSRSRA